MRRAIITACIAMMAGCTFLLSTPGARSQSSFTLVGSWDMTFSAVNGELISRKGNTLGFPDREMTFVQEDGENRGFVTREDFADVRPLGVWRVDGTRFSATFQLWCPDEDDPCGSVIMRGEFIDETRVRGTAATFFDEDDETRPTGFDTWPNTFRGSKRPGGTN
ncbi:MAG TPA: hypothetical protein VFV34_29330 [Blastocatellia bacterium]|nr:hypothetical protein [Blastocatellia bacterium]